MIFIFFFQLKNGKSAGPDKLINEFFIYENEYLSPTLCNLFNKHFEIGYFPESWTEGYISYHFIKKGA